MRMGWHFLKCDVIGLLLFKERVILKILLHGRRDLHGLSQCVGWGSVYGKCALYCSEAVY